MKILLILTMLFSIQSFASDLEKEKRLSGEYLKKMALEPNATTIESGIVVRPLFTHPSKTFPKLEDSVLVTYHLVDREGTIIDESITSDEIMNFPLTRLIQCWQLAIPTMSVGSSYKISCPSDTAYGDKGKGTIKGGAALTFRVVLHGIANKEKTN